MKLLTKHIGFGKRKIWVHSTERLLSYVRTGLLAKKIKELEARNGQSIIFIEPPSTPVPPPRQASTNIVSWDLPLASPLTHGESRKRTGQELPVVIGSSILLNLVEQDCCSFLLVLLSSASFFFWLVKTLNFKIGNSFRCFSSKQTGQQLIGTG